MGAGGRADEKITRQTYQKTEKYKLSISEMKEGPSLQAIYLESIIRDYIINNFMPRNSTA